MIVQGDARRIPLPASSVHCVVTSPPYWGLRDYGVEPSVWDDPGGCEHKWDAVQVPARHGDNGVDGSTLQGGKATQAQSQRSSSTYAFCSSCGAWHGTLGLEPTVELYVEHMVKIFREVRRVLHPSGTCFVNLGDSYATGAGKVGDCPGGGEQGERWKGYRGTRRAGKQEYLNAAMGPLTQPNRMPQNGLKPKDLCMVPFRVALALQSDGWWLRSVIPWVKRNAMPESVSDRPTTAVEYIFMLAKSERYFYDAEAVKINSARAGEIVALGPKSLSKGQSDGAGRKRSGNALLDSVISPLRRSRRNSDWFLESFDGLLVDEYGGPLAMLVNPQPFKESHFATFSEKMVEPCLRAATSERGVCGKCRAPWVRQLGQSIVHGRRDNGSIDQYVDLNNGRAGTVAKQTIGWKPSCGCEIKCRPAPTEAPLILDCFAGSGTVGVVAERLGLRFVGLELKHDYCKMAIARIDDSTKTDQDRKTERLEQAGQMRIWDDARSMVS